MKYLLIAGLALSAMNLSYADWDWDDDHGTSSASTLSPEQAFEKLKHSDGDSANVGAAVAAAYLGQSLICDEIRFGEKDAERLRDLPGAALNDMKELKKLTLKQQSENRLRMEIRTVLSLSLAEVSDCRSHSNLWKCEARRSPFVSFIRFASPNGASSKELLIERTLEPSEDTKLLPDSMSDIKRKLKALIICRK